MCCRKATFLKRRDRHGKLHFSDIRAAGFEPLATGVPIETLEKQIHALLPDGRVISQMEVIRKAYQEIGLGWLAAPTGWPVLRPCFDALYRFIAKNRLAISHFFK